MVYKLMDVLDNTKHPELSPLFSRKVIETRVEFTKTEGVTPHAELRLILDEGVTITEDNNFKTVLSCALGSNPSFRIQGGSTVTFRPQDYSGYHWKCLASFRFNALQRDATLHDFIKILTGKDFQAIESGHPSDLTRFMSLVKWNGNQQSIVGCRDVVTQWVIRLTEKNLMCWTANEVETSYELLVPRSPRREFHHFIAKGYKEREDKILEMTDDIPMRRGDFLDESFTRLTRYCGFVLPYMSQSEDEACNDSD